MKVYNYYNVELLKSNVTDASVDLLDREKSVQPEVALFLKDPEFDSEFYAKMYADLKGSDPNSLYEHWSQCGRQEGRFSNPVKLLESIYGCNEQLARIYLSEAWFYIEIHDDLLDLNCLSDAVIHYFHFGKAEGRSFDPRHWLASHGINSPSLKEAIVKILAKYSNIINGSLSSGRSSVLKVASSIVGLSDIPIEIFEGDEFQTSNLYVSLAIELLEQGDERIPQAKNLLLCANYIQEVPKVYGFLGNIAYEAGNFEEAKTLYAQAINIGNGLENVWAYINQAKSFQNMGSLEEGIDVIFSGYEKFPDSGELDFELKQFLSSYSNLTEQHLDALKARKGGRDLILDQAVTRSQILYFYWSRYFRVGIGPEINSPNNSSIKVLIVGDFHVNQCTRYRIDQKKEQLETVGHQVNTIDWTTLDDASDGEICLYDIVIFYRVPATNEVIRSIALVNALGKISIYEVDDLLFLPCYPPDLESYGGAVGVNQYHGLLKGMALMNSAVRLCQYSIASTTPLNERLKSLVNKGDGYVHRNGLDQLSWFQEKAVSQEGKLNIFYGSGTLAHNTDFTELVLPSIKKILDEFPNVQLVIMGHLELPHSFMELYKNRLRKMPKVDDAEAYSLCLSRADINLAVLHDDEINACKSELKWFEAACFQIPSIVSNTENYLEVARDGQDCLIASNQNDWYEHLKLLVTDEGARKSIGQSAHARVIEEYGTNYLGGKLSEYLKSLTNSQELVKKEKICIVNVFFPPQQIGGATRVVTDNVNVLLDRYRDQFEICVFTSNANSQEGGAHQLDAYNYRGVRVYRSGILFRGNMDWEPADSNMYDVFRAFLETERPDKIHFHCIQRLTASVVEAAADMGIPYFITAHDAWWISDHQFLVDQNDHVYPKGHDDPFSEKLLPVGVSLTDSLKREKYLRELMNKSEAIFTVSESFAEIYRANGVQNVVVTKNGITPRANWGQKKTTYTDKVVCAHIGGMSAHKGYDLVKEVIGDIQPQNILLLVVNHSEDSTFSQRVMWGEVEVNIIGRQNQNDMVQLYEKIDVLLAPSIWPESFGLVAREAAACGIWVVASNLGGMGDDVEEDVNGYKIDPSFAGLERIVNLINTNPSKYKQTVEGSVNFRSDHEQVKDLLPYYEASYKTPDTTKAI